MGSLRGGLSLAALPLPAWAGVCEDLRPGWDGAPVSAWQEAIILFLSPLSIALLIATLVALRFRSSWGVLAVCAGWSLLVSVIAFFDPTGGQGAAEGCVGSPVVFIAAVGAICVAAVLYTGRPDKQD